MDTKKITLPRIEAEKLKKSIEKFDSWLTKYGVLSHDLMDFYASKVGIAIKDLYFKSKYLGAPFAILALLQDTFFPRLVAAYRKKGREAIGDAHYALAYLNLFKKDNNKEHLTRAGEFLDALKKSSCKGYSGYCWGYTYDWQNTDTLYPVGTPFTTVTPYGFWAFLKHYQVTGNSESKNIAKSVADFLANDFKRTLMPNGTHCTSYSPIDNRYVINANTYRAAVLFEAYKEFGVEKYLSEAKINIEFVLSYQEKDGSWFYEPIGDRDRFIDNFHTCFVLRNLYYCYQVDPDKELFEAIKKGYSYYRKNLFKNDQTPLHFSVQKHNKLRRYEMYDYAEGITLGCLLHKDFEGALDFAKWLAHDLVSRFQLRDGHFVTRVTTFGNKHKVPYHRWPQSQLFYALTNLYQHF